MLYLPLDKIMQAAPPSSGALNNTDISRLTDQVLTEARNRQPSTTPAPTIIRREGR